jgi:hypothetical protein
MYRPETSLERRPRARAATIWMLVAGTLAAAIAAGALVSPGPAAAAAAGTSQISCYRAIYDFDQDGYAQTGAPPFKVDVPSGTLDCPRLWVAKAGDCDDDDRALHPRTAEVPFNDRDDEPEPLYYANGNRNTTTGFRMTVQVNDDSVVALGPNPVADVELKRLSSTASQRLPRRNVRIDSLDGVSFVTVSLSGLVQAAPYRARIRFFDARGAQVGPASDWYYTTTGGNGETSAARTAILLEGFHQLAESDHGEVGYRGRAVDGTRYGADPNELWCSEFYSWAVQDELEGSGGKASVSQLVDYFRRYDSYAGASKIAAKALRGDYLPLDTDQDGKKNHSAMFLALESRPDGDDADTARDLFVWTLEGNSGNTVSVRFRPLDKVFTGLGRIVADQLS